MNNPRLEASQIAEKWLNAQKSEHPFPIDCIRIAESLGIKVQGAELPNDFQGALFLTEEVNAIIYNNNIKEDGRKNFTIAHEIGHFILHQDKEEVKCRIDDIDRFEITPHGKTIENEANQFAASLLMPENDMANFLKKSIPDINLVLSLASRYGTTATATACQMVHVSKTPLAV
ncbi:ImmA/IrrE family metallo-endopeptidase, partial [Serratia marcescens]